jgi:hypothetical protein
MFFPHYYPTPAKVGLLIRVSQEQFRNNEKRGLALAAMEAALDLMKESEDHFGASGGEEDP